MKFLNFGSLNIDYVYKVPHFVRGGETLLSESRAVFVGGKGLNQSVALKRAGLPIMHAGLVGPEGGLLLDFLNGAGVDTSKVAVSDTIATGHALIQNDAEGDNCILLFGGANQSLTTDYIDQVLADFGQGDYLFLQNEINHLDYITEKAAAIGMQVVLNPSPINDQLKKLDWNNISILVVNEIEASELTGCPDLTKEALVNALRQTFPNHKAVLTLGKEGSVYVDASQVIHQESFPVKAVDTTAAGDTFLGFFMASLIRGKAPEEALRIASKAASIAVTRPGAAPSIPERNEVEE